MSPKSQLVATDIGAYLKAHEYKSLSKISLPHSNRIPEESELRGAILISLSWSTV